LVKSEINFAPFQGDGKIFLWDAGSVFLLQ
jgi:hypothetical protein